MQKLKKGLGAIDIFCLAAGAMISSGLFVLPGLVFAYSGPSVILIYILASLLALPAGLSQSELASAMPRAGGSYFFIARSLGSASGLFCGLADWFSVSLKAAFALVGMAAFIELFLGYVLNISTGEGEFLMRIIACAGCIVFALLNLSGTKHASRFQIALVVVLLAILVIFVVIGARSINVQRFSPFFKPDMSLLELFSVTGMVFVSYGGFTKVAAVSEEIHNPGRNIPLGMLTAWLIVSFLYFAVTAVTVGVMDAEKLSGSLTPISSAAVRFMGGWGKVLLAAAAMTAFITTANAGIMSASRSLLAMGRDKLLPPFFSAISRRNAVPVNSIIFTAVFMMATISIAGPQTSGQNCIDADDYTICTGEPERYRNEDEQASVIPAGVQVFRLSVCAGFRDSCLYRPHTLDGGCAAYDLGRVPDRLRGVVFHLCIKSGLSAERRDAHRREDHKQTAQAPEHRPRRRAAGNTSRA
jgi:basic amino acid/polyamine antiporter, APA family